MAYLPFIILIFQNAEDAPNGKDGTLRNGGEKIRAILLSVVRRVYPCDEEKSTWGAAKPAVMRKWRALAPPAAALRRS